MAGSKIKWHSLSAHAFSLHFSVLQIIQMINTEIQISKTETLLVKRLLSCIFCCYLHFAKHSQNLSGSGSNKIKLRPQPWNCSLLTTKIGDLTIAFVVFQFFCVFRKQETQDMHWGLFVVVKWPLESLPLFFFFWFFISGFCKQDVGASLWPLESLPLSWERQPCNAILYYAMQYHTNSMLCNTMQHHT